MTIFTDTEKVFLELYKAGVWGKIAHKDVLVGKHIDWKAVLGIAGKQAVVGNVSDGISLLRETEMPQPLKMKLITYVLTVRKNNETMNAAIPEMYRLLEDIGVVPVLLKGQGVAQNYRDPLSRQSGDVDLYIPDTQQIAEAYKLCQQKMKLIEPLTTDTMEAVFQYRNVVVELHGRINPYVNKTLEQRFPAWCDAMFRKEKERKVCIGGGFAVLPPLRLDLVFVFVHLTRHYFGGGIGLRQIADWMRLLYAHHTDIDQEQLAHDVTYLGIEKIWKVFAAMAVDFLGYPKEKMPLYNERYADMGKQVLRYVLDSGNFGYHDVRTKSKSKNYYVRRCKAFTGNMSKILRNFFMFPHETMYNIPGYLKSGIKRTRF